MPNLRSAIVGPLGDKAPSAAPGDQIGFYLKSSDGSECVVTKAMVQAQVAAATGNAAAKKATVLAWLTAKIFADLGASQIQATNIIADFNAADGTPSQLEVSA